MWAILVRRFRALGGVPRCEVVFRPLSSRAHVRCSGTVHRDPPRDLVSRPPASSLTVLFAPLISHPLCTAWAPARHRTRRTSTVSATARFARSCRLPQRVKPNEGASVAVILRTDLPMTPVPAEAGGSSGRSAPGIVVPGIRARLLCWARTPIRIKGREGDFCRGTSAALPSLANVLQPFEL